MCLNLSSVIGCAVPAETDFYEKGMSEKCDCWEPCVRYIYKPSISLAAFPAEHIVQTLETLYGYTEDFIKSNILDLRIYYEELNYKHIEEIPSYRLGDFWCKYIRNWSCW